MKFYRYEIGHVDSFSGLLFKANIKLEEFVMVKETPKGYWISNNFMNMLHTKPKWVSKDGRKRYAYPTKEEALVNAKFRTHRRIKILQTQLEISKSFLHEVEKEESKLQPA